MKEKRTVRASLRIVIASGLAVAPFGGVANASPDTLRLAIEDVVIGAVDVVVAPVNAGIATARNLEQVSDNPFLQGLYVVPGFLGLTFLQTGQSALRIVGGALEMLPGVALFPFPSVDLSEDANVFRRGEPMADLENPLGQRPPWLAYVLPVTPFTIDARVGPMCPCAQYAVPDATDAPTWAAR